MTAECITNARIWKEPMGKEVGIETQQIWIGLGSLDSWLQNQGPLDSWLQYQGPFDSGLRNQGPLD